MQLIQLLVSALVGMGVCMVWWSPNLMGKKYAAYTKVSAKDMKECKENMKQKMLVAYGLMFIQTLVLSFLFNAAGVHGLFDALSYTFMIAVGIVAPITACAVVWDRMPIPAYFIIAGGNALSLLGIAAALASF